MLSSASTSTSTSSASPPVAVSTNPTQSSTSQLDKTEINEAVTKVLQAYDWTLVPIATK